MVKNSLKTKLLAAAIAAGITTAGIAQAALAGNIISYGADITNSGIYRYGYAWTQVDTGYTRAKICIGSGLSDLTDAGYVQTKQVSGMYYQTAYIGHGSSSNLSIAYTK